MILVFASWIILFYCCLAFGSATHHCLKLESKNGSLVVLLGMISQTVLLSLIAFFYRIGIEAFIGNLLLSTVSFWVFRKENIQILQSFHTDFKSVSWLLKIAFGLVFFSALLKCAQPPFILDNENYYIQTIKWLNEYGFAKGLANLNIAFGQTSAWHILQAGFSFSFLTDRLNDINGFLMVLCAFYFISVYEIENKLGNKNHWIIFILLFNALSFQFISSPSPDIPLFLLAQIVFYLFVKEEKTFGEIKYIMLLGIFLLFIKMSIAPLALLLVFLWIKERKGLTFLTVSGSVFGIIWVLKNTILTGYPLFPFSGLAVDFDWTVPKELVNNINEVIRDHEFLKIPNYKQLSFVEKFLIWIQFGGINSIFNKGIIVLFVVAPFTQKFKTIKAYRILYFLLLIHFAFILIVSPQFRFFLPEFIFLSALVISDIANRIKIKSQTTQWIVIAAAVLPLILIQLIDLKSLTDNKFNQHSETINSAMILLPSKNSKYADMQFTKVRKGNLEYNSPKSGMGYFPYASGNGPLPCVTKKGIDYFENHLGIFPQLRGESLGDGFYSENVKKK